MRAAHWEKQAMIRSLKFSAPLPTSPERGEDLKMELIIDRAYMRKLHKNLIRRRGFKDLPGR